VPSRRRPGAPADLEEVRPGRFIVHTPLVGGTLRGEGEREGDRFTLTTWRREGLIARLRAKQFAVLTLADQVAALPPLPPPAPLGAPVARQPAAGERVSVFAGDPPGWRPAPEDAATPGALALREGQVIRRRKGRGPGSFALVAAGTLRPLSEDDAVRQGYAQLRLLGPATLEAARDADGRLTLPDLPLPPEHRQLLGRLADRSERGWLVADGADELAAALLARLGLELRG
jgi:hypothetical protein